MNEEVHCIINKEKEKMAIEWMWKWEFLCALCNAC